jgi:hypothetical protein
VKCTHTYSIMTRFRLMLFLAVVDVLEQPQEEQGHLLISDPLENFNFEGRTDVMQATF